MSTYIIIRYYQIILMSIEDSYYLLNITIRYYYKTVLMAIKDPTYFLNSSE